MKETASSTNQSTITESSQSTSKRTVIDQNSKTDVINRMWLKMRKVKRQTVHKAVTDHLGK